MSQNTDHIITKKPEIVTRNANKTAPAKKSAAANRKAGSQSIPNPSQKIGPASQEKSVTPAKPPTQSTTPITTLSTTRIALHNLSKPTASTMVLRNSQPQNTSSQVNVQTPPRPLLPSTTLSTTSQQEAPDSISEVRERHPRTCNKRKENSEKSQEIVMTSQPVKTMEPPSKRGRPSRIEVKFFPMMYEKFREIS